MSYAAMAGSKPPARWRCDPDNHRLSIRNRIALLGEPQHSFTQVRRREENQCLQCMRLLAFGLMKRGAQKIRQSDQILTTKILTTKMLAEYLNCHISTVYRLVNQGRIPYFMLGGDLRFERAAIDEWIAKGGGARD